MTATDGERRDGGSAERRAEELVQRAASSATRFLTRAAERTREELEDIVAEAQELRRGSRSGGD